MLDRPSLKWFGFVGFHETFLMVIGGA